MPETSAQVVVVGGGLAGRAAAVGLATAGLNVVHLAPPGPVDRRSTALMRPAVDYLHEAGLVADPAAMGHKLRRIRLIDATSRVLRAPETLFDSAEAGLDAFGWTFANTTLSAAFEAAAQRLPNLSTRPVTLLDAAREGDTFVLSLSTGDLLRCALLVGADGRNSLVRRSFGITAREHKFAEAALVADLELERPLDDTSVEFHYPHGPFTLVPASGNRASLVWIDERQVLDAAIATGPEALAQTIAARAHRLFGRVSLLGPSAVFPLSTLSVETAGRDGVMLVGEAAHAFPPIGAQGLNLGLRDIADLVEAARLSEPDTPGWAQALSTDYARRRSSDLDRTGGMVDALFRSLLSEMLPAQALRAGGIWGLKLVPALRRRAFGVGMGHR